MRIYVRAKTIGQMNDWCTLTGTHPLACVFLPYYQTKLPADFTAEDCVVDVELAQLAWTARQAQLRAA